MTIEEVRSVLKQLADVRTDDERAHSMRDLMWERVLKTLADEGSELAREALKSEEIDFARWCA